MKYKSKAQKAQVQDLKGYLEVGIPEMQNDYDKLNIETNVYISAQKAPLPPSIFLIQEFARKCARMRLCNSTYRVLMFLFGETQFSNFISIDQKTLQEELELTQKSISAAISELKKLNIVIVAPHSQDKRRNEYFINPMAIWKGKSVDRLKAIKKINKTGNTLQIGIDFEKSEKRQLKN